MPELLANLAGGFAIAATVVIFHLDRFRPILRPTILTAFLGYVLVIVAILIAGLVIPLATQQDIRARQDTENMLTNLREALLGYAASHAAGDGRPVARHHLVGDAAPQHRPALVH